MYALPNTNRIYSLILLCLCAAFFLAPTVANAADVPTTLRPDLQDLVREVRAELHNNVNRPTGTSLTTAPSAPTITKNANLGLSATTNNILKTLDQPSSFTATSNYSLNSAKTALKTCIRSSACLGRTLGAGAIIYEGIQAWKEVYELSVGNDGRVYTTSFNLPISQPTKPEVYVLPSNAETALGYTTHPPFMNYLPERNYPNGCDDYERAGYITMSCAYQESNKSYVYKGCTETRGTNSVLVGYISEPSACEYYQGDTPMYKYVPHVLGGDQIDELIDLTYEPEPSDAPIVILGSKPDTLTLTTPEPADLPSTTTTSTDAQGKTTTTVKNSVITYNILNNNTSRPSIESTITETSNTYDDTANLVGSMTSTTTNNAVQPDPLPPSSGSSAEIEIPPFCSWASIVCDWIGWTQEELGEEEPDLSQLITEFEPDEDGYDFNIGSGSCPAPIQLNLGIIDKTVEVKYEPFCDFLEMIKPFVLAAAYLFAAYLYIGVLRRG